MTAALLSLVLSATPACGPGECLYLITSAGTGACRPCSGGGGGGGAPTTAQYWTGAADATLSAEKNLGALSTGLVLNTGGTPSTYAGASCSASQFGRVLSASGVLTCAQVGWSDLSGVPGTFTPSAHTHAGGDVTSAVATATVLAANGTNCASGEAALGVSASGAAEGCWAVQQPAATTALKAGTVGGAFADYAGSSCSAGQAPLGLTAAGAVTGCFTPPGTYTLPDASAAVTGGVRLTGDLGGTAVSPTVPGLASRSGTGACGANTWASTLNGAAAPTCTQPAFSNLSGSAASAQLPAATTALGAVKMAAACGAGNHVSSIGAGGELTCSADSGGAPVGASYVTTAADATLTNEVVLPTCSGTDKLTFNGTTISCAADQTGGAGSANAVEVDVDFGSTESDDLATTVVTGQAWVTATSKIACAPTMLATTSRDEGAEDAVIEGLIVAVHSRVAGTGFTVTVAATAGLGTTGVYKIHCTGV